VTGVRTIAEADDAVRRAAALEARNVRHIARLEALNPDIMIWPPDGSVSGEWEALGDGWLIQDKSAAGFRKQLDAKVNRGRGTHPPGTATAEPSACAPGITVPSFVTVAELAAVLRIHRNAVYRLIKAGTVTADRTVPGRPYRISGASVRAYLGASRPGASAAGSAGAAGGDQAR
jgi:excisionase family DNA binding protein